MKSQRHLKRLIFIITLTCFAFVHTNAQRFDIYEGDTINCINKKNQKEGHWIIFKSGTEQILQKGSYLKGKKEGLWTTYYTGGQKKSEISYLQDEKNGYAVIYFENGNIAEEGIWLVDKWVGKYKSYYENGKLFYSWNYNNKGTRSGYQQYFYKNGEIKIEGEWLEGKETGTIREYYSSGTIKAEKKFNEGKVDPEAIKIYNITENKNDATDTNVNDTQDSDTVIAFYTKADTVKVFHGNGKHVFYNKHKKVEKDGFFTDGILTDGKHYIYNKNGVLIRTLIYKEGKITEVNE